MDDPDVILEVDADADGRTENPVIRQRLGPERIHLEPRSRCAGLRLRGRALLEPVLADTERHDAREKSRANDNVSHAHHAAQYTVAGVMKDRVLALAVSHCRLRPLAGRWPLGARHPERRDRPGAASSPDGQRVQLLVRAPLKAMRDVEYPMRGADRLDVGRADAILHDAATVWLVNNIDLYEGDTAARRRAHRRRSRVAARRQVVRARSTRRSPMSPVAPLPADTELFWSQGLIDVLIEYPIQSDRSEFSINPRFARLGQRTVTVLRFMPPGGAVRAFEYPGGRGPGPARSPLASGRPAVRPARLLAHPRRNRPPAVSRLPGHSVPATPRARARRDVLHARALGDAHRVRLRSRARRALVSAAHRDAHRHVHRLHGAREHRRRPRSRGGG